MPESPRYLVSRGRHEEAAALLRAMSTVQVTAADLMTTAPTMTKPSTSSTSTTTSSTTSAVQVLFGPQLRLTTSVLLCIWFTLSFGSYGMSTWISVLFEDVGIGNAYAASFLFAFANLPGNVISLLLIDRYGRRALLGWGMGLAGLSSLGFALDTKDAAVVVLFASLFNAFSTQGWNSLDCLSVEMFPTEVRSSAMGLLAAGGRLGAIAAQFVNGSLERDIPLLLFVTTSCSLAGGLVAFALPYDSSGPLQHHAIISTSEEVLHYSPIHTSTTPEEAQG